MEIRFKKWTEEIITAVIHLAPYKLIQILNQWGIMETAVYFKQTSSVSERNYTHLLVL